MGSLSDPFTTVPFGIERKPPIIDRGEAFRFEERQKMDRYEGGLSAEWEAYNKETEGIKEGDRYNPAWGGLFDDRPGAELSPLLAAKITLSPPPESLIDANDAAVASLKRDYMGDSGSTKPMGRFMISPAKHKGTTRKFLDSDGQEVIVGWGSEKEGDVDIVIDNPDKFSSGWWGELSEKLGYAQPHPNRVWESAFGGDGSNIKKYAERLGEAGAPNLFAAVSASSLLKMREEVYGLNGMSKYGGTTDAGLKKWWDISKNDDEQKHHVLKHLADNNITKRKGAIDAFVKSNFETRGGKRAATKEALTYLSGLGSESGTKLLKSMVATLINSKAGSMLDADGKVRDDWKPDPYRNLDILLEDLPEHKQDYTNKLKEKIQVGKDYWDELSGNEDTREMVEGIIHELKVHESSRRGTYLDRDSKGNRIVASSLGINARGKFSNIYKGTTVLSEEDASRNLPLAYIKQVMINNSKLKWVLDKFKGDASGIFSSAWQYGMGVFDGINKDQDPTLSEVSEQVMGIGGYHQSFKFVARNFSEHAGEPALKENSSQTYSFEGNRGEAFKDYYNGRTGIVKNGLGIRVIRTNRDKKPSGVAINETGDVVSKVDWAICS